MAVICTGPTSDVARTTDPLLRHLLDTGTARVGPHRLGLAIDATGHLRDRADQPVPGLFALGPLRRGTVFEATAIPELCVQATELAHQLGRVAEAD